MLFAENSFSSIGCLIDENTLFHSWIHSGNIFCSYWWFLGVIRTVSGNDSWLCSGLSSAIVFQVFLILIVPRSSFVPDILLERSGITDFLEGSVCDTEGYLRMLKSFWGANIDFDKVRIVQGGMMANLAFLNKLGMIKDGHVRSAMTFGNTIYLGNITPCPTGELYFHEMTHVWQTQTQQSHLFGLKSVSGWIRLHYAQVVNPDPLYNYGGYYGLLAAKNQNKKFLDFNIEEQAMIVEHWYWIIKKGYVLPEGEVLTEKYAKLLEYYVSDMLQNKD